MGGRGKYKTYSVGREAIYEKYGANGGPGETRIMALHFIFTRGTPLLRAALEISPSKIMTGLAMPRNMGKERNVDAKQHAAIDFNLLSRFGL